MNRLANERSPYLRHAAEQPIDWHPWGDEAFNRAAREGKPVFLSSGGVWCHWCHVMAEETFRDPEVAAILNERFISIKLDRDERPDIDRRYQQSVALMGHAGGWPLTVFLTADRRPFFGGTYFPPEDRHGRPGFRKVLRSIADFYAGRRGEAEQYADRVLEALRSDTPTPGDLRAGSLDSSREAMLAAADREHGGFGTSPKFPMPGALEFLLRRAAAGDRDAEAVVRRTLDGMARGGFRDHLGGGFHRYSVDEGWFVPHFEKMADDNAWLLRTYTDAFAVLGDPVYGEVSRDIIRFAREVLSDPAGGFYASQDADVAPGDEGGYFTWTEQDLQAALTIEEYEVLQRHFLHERGRLPHDPDKRVLSLVRTPQEVAAALGRDAADLKAVITGGKRKLLAARRLRETPFIDRTLYTSLNGLFITAFLRAFRVLGDQDLRDFALLSLGRILRERWADGVLLHTEGVPAVLDDGIFLAEALAAAYEATGERTWLERATALMDESIARFGDPAGGFFDTAGDVLGTRLKRIEDVPHPSANAVAAELLLKLGHLTGREGYREAAERTLRAFAGSAGEMVLHAGTYCSSLDAWFRTLTLTVEAPPDSALARAALRLAGMHTAVRYGEDRGRVIPCLNETCFEPVTDPSALVRYATAAPR